MDKTQEWKMIKGTGRKYYVSSDGRIYSRKVKLELSLNKDKNGYIVVSLCLNGNEKQFKVHRLVADAFCRHYSRRTEVNHKNGIKDDNRAENLEWVSHGENQRHRRRVLKHGECPLVNLDTKKSYRSIWEAYKTTGESVTSISKKLYLGVEWAWIHRKMNTAQE